MNASTQLKAFDRLNQVNANNPRPIKGRLRIGRFIKYAYGNDAARKNLEASVSVCLVPGF